MSKSIRNEYEAHQALAETVRDDRRRNRESRAHTPERRTQTVAALVYAVLAVVGVALMIAERAP